MFSLPHSDSDGEMDLNTSRWHVSPHAWDRWFERFEGHLIRECMHRSTLFNEQRTGDTMYFDAQSNAVFVIVGRVVVRTVLTKEQALNNLLSHPPRRSKYGDRVKPAEAVRRDKVTRTQAIKDLATAYFATIVRAGRQLQIDKRTKRAAKSFLDDQLAEVCTAEDTAEDRDVAAWQVFETQLVALQKSHNQKKSNKPNRRVVDGRRNAAERAET